MSDPESLNASAASQSEGVDSQDQPRASLRTAPVFSASRLRWQLRLDLLLRLLVAIGVVGMLLYVADWAGGSTLAVVLAVALAIGAWMLINGISARTSSELPRISALIEDAPAEAEDQLAYHLSRRPLLRWVRLMLYHRLALLRHRQGRHTEAAAICHHVLGYKLGPAEGARHHLLLLLAEAQIDRNDPAGAYPAIASLHHASLSLIEAMQRLALQTRYELLAGFPARALWRCAAKVRLAELMPATHNGAIHGMLATAADRCRKPELGRWLWNRVALLATEDQQQRFREGRFSLNVVSPPDDVTGESA